MPSIQPVRIENLIAHNSFRIAQVAGIYRLTPFCRVSEGRCAVGDYRGHAVQECDIARGQMPPSRGTGSECACCQIDKSIQQRSPTVGVVGTDRCRSFACTQIV